MQFFNIKKLIINKPKLGSIFPRLNVSFPSPLCLLIHITLTCNRKCNWCYQQQDTFYNPTEMNMPVGAFKAILRTFKYFKPHIHLYGGEPLLHQEFPLFLEIVGLCGYEPTLTTNGDYLDKYSRIIIQSSLSQLNLSLNGIIDYRGNFNQHLHKNIKDFLNLNKGRKIINLNLVINKETFDYLEDLVLYLNKDYKKGDFVFLVLQHLNFQTGIDVNRPVFDLVKLATKLANIKKMKLKFKLLFMPDIKLRDLSVYYESEHVFKNTCYVPWLGLSIYPDLSVTPGGGIFGCNYNLGNLAQGSIMDIWRGEELRDFRLKLIKKGLPRACNRCCHKRYY